MSNARCMPGGGGGGVDWYIKGRDDSICERLADKKGLQKLSSKEFWLRHSSLAYYRVNTIWCVFRAPFHC